ncbi:MAG: aminotransferase class V-fold PLP-dependent enzyme [Roseivirga sp.]|jgi:selenocysteine lyase/cysteine desulfurase|uniref:aminotransferase class V-fold PLP-dependent enzyme n=1 Tax=Roseivirga sp. TaxID=1964215 RepID=UPI001B201A4B|nr:aminotransferase class V-fold PLP-dependent enzyme [Roseivirga sp.]MBO6494974.1 aminotransferase class V-fold PLP-dependent enzyme [Roseivirga sp.]
MSNRRSFFRKSFLTAGTLSLSSFFQKSLAEDISDALLHLNTLSPEDAAQDEELWARIQQAYTTSSSIINLNNGGVSPQPKVVQDAANRFYTYCNEAPSYYMWRILDQGREPLRAKLAHLAGTEADELAINRNTTEAINTVIFGLNLKAGDEVILTKYDYPNMMNAWKQREQRDGIVLKWLDFDIPMKSDDEVIRKYREAITPKTKVLHITHIINWTGHIMPVKGLCDLARKNNLYSIVDGAHSFAHLDFKISDFGCDFFGTSLHKWLCAPFGTGLLYIDKNKIKDVWPLLGAPEGQEDNIRKFENIGTRSFAIEQAIGSAIDFHQAIGSARKEARLKYLKQYWVDQVTDVDKVRFYTSTKPQFSGALFNFGIDGQDAGPVHNSLFNTHKIHTSPVKYEKVNGPRITPHVYTTKYDLDRLVEAIHVAAKA